MSDFKHPPLHRHDALVPLSRDHYVGLVCAQRLKKAADGDQVARRNVVAEYLDAWDAEIAPHLTDEEDLLLELSTEEERRRLTEDHLHLRDLTELIRVERRKIDPDPALLRNTGEALESHIRWEERELFCRLQAQLSEQQLDSLFRETEKIEISRRRIARRQAKGESDALR